MSGMTWEGLDDMTSALQKLGARAARVENKALKSGAKELQETMARNAPGPSKKDKAVHLPDNIQVGRIQQKEYGKAAPVGPGKDAFYVQFLEFGTSKMSPKPFIESSVTDSQGRVIRAMADELRDGIGL
ncbi:HK97 gp10 family phage protein [Hazenella sp. IB182357]|uniref:HK97 gp10 family phage protein n=1 Tax=Polycladospora coralii TaxID=2771432 RepID=A0A926NB94_9BACL|nr:HK97-gp10 family putative phage morphogenesis protein [Polycladospora coralii]MBD1373716.1 HK97 gp10 family phage protein [Polycladospora coralii]